MSLFSITHKDGKRLFTFFQTTLLLYCEEVGPVLDLASYIHYTVDITESNINLDFMLSWLPGQYWRFDDIAAMELEYD